MTDEPHVDRDAPIERIELGDGAWVDVARGSGALPRWLTVGGLVAGSAGLVTPLVGVVSPDAYVPLPFMLCLLWVACTGVVLARRPLRAGSDQSATNPAQDPLPASA